MPHSTEVELDRSGRAVVINASDVDISAEDIATAIQPSHPLIAELVRWSGNTQQRAGNILDRDRFVTPGGTFDQIRLARQAIDDDVVGNVAETTESLAFKRTSFSTDDVDEESFWNQWAGDVKLDARLREAWRVQFTDSQFVVGIWWGEKDYKVKGRTKNGNARRKVFNGMRVPLALTFIDSLKVWPVGSTMFNQERLVYLANREEADAFDRSLGGAGRGWNPLESPMSRGPARMVTPTVPDPIVERLIESHYVPTTTERREMGNQGIDVSRLYLLRPDAVFRHTHTRPQYDKFARVRLKSVFELLDIKEQLRQMDRAHLIGGTNFILLIKQGTDKAPAEPEEIAHLRANVRTIAKVPVIVADHRLSVEIVTPKLDTTLNRERYDTVDARILARLYRMLVPTGGGAGGEDVEKLGKVIGANLMSERHMMLRSLEENLFDRVYAANTSQLTERAKLRFHPARIALEFDNNFAMFLLDLRQAREISRDTMLSNAELDQEHEARMLEREADEYDDIFQTAVPFNSPANRPAGQGNGAEPPPDSPAARRAGGRRGGGNRGRGGAAPGSGQGKAPANPRRTSDRGRSRASLLDEAQDLGIRGRSRMNVDELAEAIEAARIEDEES